MIFFLAGTRSSLGLTPFFIRAFSDLDMAT